MSSELQAAFEISQSTTDRNPDADKIASLVAAGRFVLAAEYPVYCRFTDAFLGTGKSYRGDFSSREEAQALADTENGYDPEDPDYFPSDTQYVVLPKVPVVYVAPVVAFDQDVCPF